MDGNLREMTVADLFVTLGRLPPSAKVLIPSGGDAPSEFVNSDGLAPVRQVLRYGENVFVLSADPIDHY